MDINQRVAARREQLAQQESRAKAEARQAETQLALAKDRQREQAIKQIAEELQADGLPIEAEGDRLKLKPELPPLDRDAMKGPAIEAMLDREARRLWTPAQNWQVIGGMVAGLFTIPFFGLGLILIGFSFWRGTELNTRYQLQLRARYPDIFDVKAPHLNLPIAIPAVADEPPSTT